MSALLIQRPDPADWPDIFAKWGVIREGKRFVITFMGKRFGDGKPYVRKADAERQADTNRRSEMMDVLRGQKPYTLADFGMETA